MLAIPIVFVLWAILIKLSAETYLYVILFIALIIGILDFFEKRR